MSPARSLKESRLSLSYDEIQAVIEQSYDGILVTNSNADVLFVNDAYFRITELPKEEVVGKNFREFITGKPYKRIACLDALKNSKPVTYTHTNLVLGKTIMVTATPIMNKCGKVSLVVTNCRDMTEMVLLREELEKAQEMEQFYSDRPEPGRNGAPVAVSSEMRQILGCALRISAVDITVLITGESGVGKEVVAKYIHENSPRHTGPFVTVNCGAIPEQLMESEFFGYVGGAFTGANKVGKAGLFETAHHGTIFLDEIGELPLNLQVKLLRVLESREITRVGCSTPTPIDVRVLAATNRDLKQMVEAHEFRDDLYYRLNVVELHIPALKERPEDIRPLCIHFLRECNRHYGLNKRLAYDVLYELENYAWPGNIRELKNVIERMVVMSNGDYLELSSIPWFKDAEGIDRAITVNRLIPIPQAIEQVERQILLQALKHHESSRKIAKITGIDQTTVLRKLKKYQLSK